MKEQEMSWRLAVVMALLGGLLIIGIVGMLQ
jgi:hypothetical protein